MAVQDSHAWRTRLYEAIGARVREKRLEAGLSQDALGKQVNLTQATISAIEEGRTPCRVCNLVKLAEVFDTTLDDLVPVTVDS